MTNDTERPVRSRKSAAHLALLALALPILLAACARPVRPPDMGAINRAVSAAEGTFLAMKARDYPGIWARLTSKSRETVADETLEALGEGGGKKADRESILADFRDGGPVARNYWGSFLAHFNPDTALAESRWEAAEAGTGEILVLITYRTADRPAALKMFLEDGAWKFGLVETFWSRP